MATTTTTQIETAPSPLEVTHDVERVPSTQADGLDHPEGDAIRRQVEYYFSDENLPTDEYYLRKCGGRANIPVLIKSVCGSPKMRAYKPRTLVVAALRKSTFLQVSADGKSISRKVPLQGKCILDPDFYDVDDIAYAPTSSTSQAPAVRPVVRSAPPPARNELPPGMTKNMMKPTGFEATHVEGPLTPQEAAEEGEMYDADRMFVDRIELAISRFQRTRRKHAKYAHIFDALMRLGGVEQTSHMFQGLSKHDMEEMDAEEISRATAKHSVPWDRQEADQWVVDFVGLIKAFLSSYYPAHHGMSLENIKNVCQVPRSFYNYLRYHGVCPEYDDQLKEALQICDKADRELPMIMAIGRVLPGQFNKAASVHFGGSQADLYTGDKSWAIEVDEKANQAVDPGLSKEEASAIFKTGVALMGSEEQINLLAKGNMATIFNEQNGLEIIDIVLPTEDTKAVYAESGKILGHKLSQLEPLGKLICKSWIAEDFGEWDLPKDKYPADKPKAKSKHQLYEFWVEESSLEGCFVGMKLDATVSTLNGGIMILDEIREAMCSFYAWLPNEMWVEQKPKPVVWRKRPLNGESETDIDTQNAAGDGAPSARGADAEGDCDDESRTGLG